MTTENQANQQGLEWKERAVELKKHGGFKRIIQPLFDKNLTGIHYFDTDEYDEDDLNLFLNEPDSQEQRDNLKASLKALLALLKSSDSIEGLENKANELRDLTAGLRIKNLSKIIAAAKPLEESFRQLDLYYANAGTDEIEHISILDVNREKLIDHESQTIPEKVRDLISKPHKKIDQDEVYSMLLIPGFLGEHLITSYAETASKAKVLLFTDYKDINSVQKIKDYRESNKGKLLGGPQPFWRHASVFANYIRLRDKHRLLGEKDDLYGAPSIAIAAGLYNLEANIAQPFGGFLVGGVKKSNGLRIEDIDQDQVKIISDLGINPMVDAFSQHMAFDARTLFEGENTEFIQYAVVRTFDYIDKTLKHFLNKNILKVLNNEDAQKVKDKILDFLADLKERNIIEEGEIDLFQRDKNKPDMIHVKINIKPLWATRNFIYTIDVAKGKLATSDLK